MTKTFFDKQIERLKVRFGPKHFDAEFQKLASEEVSKMSDDRFAWVVSTWIGSRKPTDPPRIAEFKEARLAEEKSKKQTTLERAARVFEARNGRSPLEILEPHVGKVESVMEAIEVRRLQIMRERDANPNYDPMQDPKWKKGAT